MIAATEQNTNNWKQTNIEFHAYLQETLALLKHKQVETLVDVPLPPQPVRQHKAPSWQQIPLILAAPPTNLKPPAPAIEVRAVAKPAKARLYSSPLWVGLGDEDEGPGGSNRKTKYKKKAK